MLDSVKTGKVALRKQEALPFTREIRATKEIKYVAGPDKKWFTKDDEVYHYFTAQYDSEGEMINKKCYSPGKDNTAFSPDDTLQGYFVYDYDPEGGPLKETSYKLTESGKFEPVYYALYQHTVLGRKAKSVRYNPQGKIIRCIIFEYNPQGKVVKDVEYIGPGPDNKWFIADDEIEKYHKREYDGDGRMVRAMEYLAEGGGKGLDGKWFTPDDVITSARVFSYNKDGQVAQTNKYIAAGADNQWFTDDDVLQYYTLRYYDKVN
jgi:hypothetical protein